MTRSSSSYPAVVCYLAGARSELKPAIQRQGSYQFIFLYSLTVPAKKTVSLLHGLAQRRGIASSPALNTLAEQFKPFQHRQWIRGLPAEVRRSLLNADRPYYSAETVRGPILQSVMNLAADWDVERGQTDVLVQDKETRVPGMVLGSALVVDTQFGQATVPLADVAVLVGGAGLEDRVFCERNCANTCHDRLPRRRRRVG